MGVEAKLKELGLDSRRRRDLPLIERHSERVSSWRSGDKHFC